MFRQKAPVLIKATQPFPEMRTHTGFVYMFTTAVIFSALGTAFGPPSSIDFDVFKHLI